MQVSHLISELHNSTKAILIACSAFLVVTASVLLFLMLFPIKAKDPVANLVTITTETESTTTTRPQAEEWLSTTKEPPHTLSTWGVSIETITTTLKPDPTTTAWFDAILPKKTSNSENGNYDYNHNNNVYDIPEPEFVETQPVAPEPEEIDIPLTDSFSDMPAQTVTEVIDPPAVTDAQPSVVTDPPVTAPPNRDNSENDPIPAPPPAEPEKSEDPEISE